VTCLHKMISLETSEYIIINVVVALF
jgi:hypothetical protein